MKKNHNLVVANWKMNPSTLDEAKGIFDYVRSKAEETKNTTVVVCPPFTYIQPLYKLKFPKNIFLGAQNMSEYEKGAHTGEVSANILKNIGASYTIIGHSERRAAGETDQIIRKKLEIAFANNLIPILCIGEKERDKEGLHLDFIKNQIIDCLKGLSKKNITGLIVAYEPIWAIGKSVKEAMNPTDIHVITLYIKKIVGENIDRDTAKTIKILYGGSVEAENAGSIMQYGNVNGFLVGHASLSEQEFYKILQATT